MTGHLYIAAFSARGPSLIGHADHPAKRIAELQPGCADPIRIFFAAALPDAKAAAAITAALHKALNRHRRQGDWFKIAPAKAATTAKEHLRRNGHQWREQSATKPSQRAQRRHAAIEEYMHNEEDMGFRSRRRDVYRPFHYTIKDR